MTALTDRILELSLDLNRVDAHTRAEIEVLLRKMERELVAAASDLESSRSKARIEKLIAEANAIIKDYYTRSAQIALDTTSGVVQVSVTSTASALAEAAANITTVAIPSESYIERLAGKAIIQGAVQSDWWARQSGDVAWRFSSAVRQGIASAETNGQIISRIRTGLGVSRRNAAALVQTSVQTVANEARMAVFEDNSELISAYRWVATLDSHTCIACAARDGKRWDIDHKPIDHSLPWANGMLHFNDRCLIVPVTKTWEEMGVTGMKEPKAGTRASDSGQVSASTTFAGFLERKGAEYQDGVLGKGRAQMWRDGKLTLEELVNGNGMPLTLAQLRKKYG